MTRVVMVIASRGFRDEEYAEPRALLERAGAQVTVACSRTGEATGMLGMKVKPDVLLAEVRSADYDAIAFVGGGGSKEYWDDPVAHRLAREFAERQKPTTAICLAPVTLARAGLLKGRAATVWPDATGEMVKQGANAKSQGVVCDGHFITADGPQSAKAFGQALVKALGLEA
jgi:deglycase